MFSKYTCDGIVNSGVVSDILVHGLELSDDCANRNLFLRHQQDWRVILSKNAMIKHGDNAEAS